MSYIKIKCITADAAWIEWNVCMAVMGMRYFACMLKATKMVQKFDTKATKS